MASNSDMLLLLPSSLPKLPLDEQVALRGQFGGTHGASLSAAWWVCVAVATTVLVLRLFDRVLYSGSERQRLRTDDWLLAAAWAAFVGAVSCGEVMRGLFGLGFGLEAVVELGLEGMLKLNLIATVLGMLSIALTKLSLAALYSMWVIGDDGTAGAKMPRSMMRVSLGIFSVILLAATFAFPLAHVLACGDIELHWTIDSSESSFNNYEQCLGRLTTVADAHFAMDMFSDAAFVLLAGPIVYSVGVTKRTFLAAAGALAIAACAVIAASMRMSISHGGDSGVGCLLTWLIAESSLLLVLASGLGLRALFARLCRPPQPTINVRWSTAPGEGGVPHYSLGGSSGSGASHHKAAAHNSWSKASCKGSSYKGSGVFGSMGRSSGDVYREGMAVAVGSGSLMNGVGGGGMPPFLGGMGIPGSRASTNPGEDFEIKPVEKLRIIRQDGKLMVERVSSAHGPGATGGGFWGDEEYAAERSPYERLEFLMDTKR